MIESTPIAISSMVTDANKSYSKAIAPIFSRIERTNKSINHILAETSISINDKGKLYIDKKGKENKNAKVTYNVKVAKDSANKNAVISGVTGYGKDVYQYVKEKPFSAGISLASTVAGGAAVGAGSKVAGAALGIGLRGASTAAGTGKVASKLYAASAYSEQLINAGLVGKLTIDIGNVAKEKDYKALTGTIVNLAVGGIGFTKGQTAGLRGVDVARTIGKKEVSASSIIAKDILSGKKQIPTTKHGTPVKNTIASFKDPITGEVIGYHTSPVQLFGKIKSKVGRPLDQPGLYVSPLESGPSMYFSRIQGKDVKSTGVMESLVADISGLTSAAGKVKPSDIKITASAIVNKVTGKQKSIPESVINLKSAVKSTPKNIVNSVLGTGTPLPVVNKIHIKKVERAPKKIRYDLKATQKAMDAAKPGKAYITYKYERNIRKGDAETEATIVPNTILKKLKSDRYFMYNGRVVTITEYKALEAAGKIKKGQMGKRELTTREKHELLKRYSESKAKVSASKKVKTVKESRVPTQKRGVKPAVRGSSASKSHVSKPKKGLKAPISNYRTGKAYDAKSAVADRKTPYKAPKANYRAPVRASTRKTALDKSTNTVNRRQPKKPEIRRSGSSRKRENPVSEIVRLDQLVRSSAPVRRQEPTSRTPARAQDQKKPTQKAVSSGRVPNRYPKPNMKNTDYTAKRKAKSVKTTRKQKKDTKHLQRKIKNTLGSMKSMFG